MSWSGSAHQQARRGPRPMAAQAHRSDCRSRASNPGSIVDQQGPEATISAFNAVGLRSSWERSLTFFAHFSHFGIFLRDPARLSQRSCASASVRSSSLILSFCCFCSRRSQDTGTATARFPLEKRALEVQNTIISLVQVLQMSKLNLAGARTTTVAVHGPLWCVPP